MSPGRDRTRCATVIRRRRSCPPGGPSVGPAPAGHPEVGRDRSDCQTPQDGDQRGRDAQPAAEGRTAHPVGERRAQGTGQDVGGPEGGDVVQAEPATRQHRQCDEAAEHEAGDEVAQLPGVGGQVAHGRAQRERGDHGGPVEALAAAARDRGEGQRPLQPVPDHEDRQNGEQVSQRGDPERDAQEVGDVGGHGAEDPDHGDRQPVHGGDVAGGAELRGETRHQGQAGHGDRDDAAPSDQRVGGGLAHSRGEDLEDPEPCGDGRHLGDGRFRGTGKACGVWLGKVRGDVLGGMHAGAASFVRSWGARPVAGGAGGWCPSGRDPHREGACDRVWAIVVRRQEVAGGSSVRARFGLSPSNRLSPAQPGGRQRVLLGRRVRAGRAQLAQHRVDLAVDRGPGGRVARLELGLRVVPGGLEVGDAGGGPGLVAAVEEVAGVLGDGPELREVAELRRRGGRPARRPAPVGVPAGAACGVAAAGRPSCGDARSAVPASARSTRRRRREQHPDHDDGLQQSAAPGLLPVRLPRRATRAAADDVGLGHREVHDDGDDGDEEDQAGQGGAEAEAALGRSAATGSRRSRRPAAGSARR